MSRKHLKIFPVREKIGLVEKEKEKSHFHSRMWNYGQGDWRQANSYRALVSWGIRCCIGADDGYRGGPDLLKNMELRGKWGDRIHFLIYCFIPRSAFLAAGYWLTHEGSVPSACQRVSTWRGACLNPPRSGEGTALQTGEEFQHTCKQTCAEFHWNFDFTISPTFQPPFTECFFGWKCKTSILAVCL